MSTDSKRITTTVTNPRNNATVYSIISKTQTVVAVMDALGNSTSRTLNGNLDPIVITLPNKSVIQASYLPTTGKQTAVTRTVTSQGAVQTITTNIEYSPLNDPKVITDGNGNKVNLAYDAKGNPQTVQDPVNSQPTSFEYDSQGRVTKVTTLGGLVTTYNYSGQAGQQFGLPDYLLQSYQTLVGSSTTPVTQTYRVDFTYTPQGWLASQTDPYLSGGSAGPKTSYGYNEMGQVISITNQLGQSASFQYDPAGNLTGQTNFLGQQTSYSYDPRNRQTAITQTLSGGDLHTYLEYDETDNLKKRTDPRGVDSLYQYDELNRVVTAKVPLQNPVGSYAQVNYTYDPSGNISTTTRVNNVGGNQVTSYTYDELNRVILVDNGLNSQQKYVYDKAGNVLTLSQHISGTSWVDITTDYDGLNRPKTQTISGVNLTTQYSYSDAQNLRSVTDPYGVVSTVQSDALGRVLRQSVGSQQNSYNFYDGNGSLLRTIDAEGNWTDYSYDGLHRPIAQTRYTGSGNAGTALTTQMYYTDTAQPQVTTIGPAPHYQRQDNFYDQVGRLTSSKIYTGTGSTSVNTIPGGALTTSFSYDPQGNLVTRTDATGHVTAYSYENAGWLTSATEKMNSGLDLVSLYSYDPLGNLLKVQDGAGRFTYYRYDLLSRVISQSDSIGTWQTAYDGLNRVVARTDGKTPAQTSLYSYDNASRLLSVSSANNLNTSYSYAKNLPTPTRMTDQLWSGASFQTDYDYDTLGRLTSVSSPNGVVKYDYDNLNRRKTLQFGPDALNLKTVNYGYDGLSRPQAITLTNWNNVSPQTLSYSYSGLYPSVVTYPNSTKAVYGFNGAGWLTGITQTNTGTNNIIYQANYTLDRLGNRSFVSEIVSGQNRTSSYGYDDLSRLTSEIQQVGTGAALHPVTSTYSYDGAGNRTAMYTTLPSNTKPASAQIALTSTYLYNSASQLISRTEVGNGGYKGYGYSYQYDPNGSLISELNNLSGGGGETTSYSYDSRNRLVQWNKQVKSSTIATATFSYDGADNRLSMGYNNRSTKYLQDQAAGLEVVLQETASGVVTPSSFLYPLGSTSPLYKSDQNGVGVWYHADGLGSVRALTNQSGVVTSTYSYSAFGQNIGETGKTDNNHLFAGEQLDPTGLYYNRARYYDPSIGQFTQRDSFGGNLAGWQSLNRYSYGLNNPLRYIDPNGHIAFLAILAAVGIAALVGGIVGAGISYGVEIGKNFNKYGFSYETFFTKVNWADVAGGAVSGAVGGAAFAVGVATLGTGFAAIATAGAISGVLAGQAATNTLNGKKWNEGLFNLRDIVIEAILGAAFASIGNLIIKQFRQFSTRSDFVFDDTLQAGVGETTFSNGRIRISPEGTELNQLQALRHEEVHAFLRPQGFLGEVRRDIRRIGYNNSALLKYSEEAIAESVAQFRTGTSFASSVVRGLKFPFNPAYEIDPLKLAFEASTVLAGYTVGTGFTAEKVSEWNIFRKVFR